MPVNGSCCGSALYRFARSCGSGTVTSVGMTKANADGLATAYFEYAGGRYFFNYADTPSPLVPATLITPADVTGRSNCWDAETCSCITSRYRIASYVDGDFTPLSPGNCASNYSGLRMLCNGRTITPNVWDGSFYGSRGVGGGQCVWFGRCDNTATGDEVNGSAGLCASNTLLYRIFLSRSCTIVSGVVTNVLKNIEITYIKSSGPGPFVLWAGQNTGTTSQEMDVTFTRTSGDDATAAFTLEHF